MLDAIEKGRARGNGPDGGRALPGRGRRGRRRLRGQGRRPDRAGPVAAPPSARTLSQTPQSSFEQAFPAVLRCRFASAEYALKHVRAARQIPPYNRGRRRHMSDHHARSARDDVYDHEHEEPRSGRRRRPVADWGVGEDMFEHMPRNRFSRDRRGAAARAPLRPRGRPRARGRADERRGSAPRARGRRAERRASPPSPARTSRAAGSTTAAARSGSASDEDVPSEIAAIAADRDISTDEVAAPVPSGGRRPSGAP